MNRIKIVIALAVVAFTAAAFGSGFLTGQLVKKPDSQENTYNDNYIIPEQKNDLNTPPINLPENKEPIPMKNPINVFFSPHTGSDEQGDGSQNSPFLSIEKAKEHSKTIIPGDNEEVVILEYIMTVNVKTSAAAGVSSSSGGVNMIPFTGSADSYYFKGEIVGQGCDTQKYAPDGSVMFSARYLLKGTDCDGNQCSIFIENNGPALELCTPTVITDSAALSDLETSPLRAIVVPVSGGVDVNMYKIHSAQ